ncbi:hypothetical protein J8273_2717 [Carpediemonas membranifera]|uniref:Uncharacterized protein n=1 Tax=Carpediemonas membranifera TaxID=201153 RepID=A0A8J6B0I8_9EUKA|nr:hypothetical protein J8273_2717 [Carpediemonas membranifera]|eukprot:KAG9395805.1 hypothetical protein J8273_2717 [Carpediemonas membranifera]
MNSRGLNRFSLTAHLSYTRRVADMRASAMVRATVLGGILVLAPAETSFLFLDSTILILRSTLPPLTHFSPRLYHRAVVLSVVGLHEKMRRLPSIVCVERCCLLSRLCSSVTRSSVVHCRGVTALTPAMKRRLRVHVNWSATKNLTDEQVDRYERDHGDITKLRRVLSVKTDGVSVAVTVWVGREKYRGGRVADRPTYKKDNSNKRARLGQDDAEATPAPDIQARMGFDPGARSLGGYTIRRPDGQSVSGVLAKCGYTATPSFRVNMSAASFKTTSLEALKQSIRFVHENIVQIINEGTRKCFRRATSANHCLRQKHFARAGRQLLDDLGGRPQEPIHRRVWGCTVRFRQHSLVCSVPPLCSSSSWHHAPAQRRRDCHDGLRIPHFHRVPILQSTLQTRGAHTPHHALPESRVRGSSMAR